MRLPDDARRNRSGLVVALCLSIPLAACGSGSANAGLSSVAHTASAPNGPESDYPQVLGEPFTVDGELFTPEDSYSYDQVGFASLGDEGGDGVTVAHKTLPLPSYVEVTSLETGRTILTRVERRGPMTASRLVALSPGAARQLGMSDGEAVRVRRVNPPEVERAELRMGNTAPERLSTPASLLAVLKRNLPLLPQGPQTALSARTSGSATLLEPVVVAPSTALAVAPQPDAAEPAPAGGLSEANGAYPLQQLAEAVDPPSVMEDTPPSASPRTPPAPVSDAGFVVQAGTFASKLNAERLAGKLDGGFVTRAGKFYRVRVGPYPTRGQAEAALAKVRAAGYSDAQIFSAG